MTGVADPVAALDALGRRAAPGDLRPDAGLARSVAAVDAGSGGLPVAAINWARILLSGGDASGARMVIKAHRAASPMARICTRFGLSRAEEDVLLVALAHRLDATLAPLCGEVMGDPRQSYVTCGLITRLIADDAPEFAAALVARLAPTAPLRRWALIETRETHALAALTLPEDLTLRLLTAATPEPEGCTAAVAGPALPAHERLVRTLAARIGAGIALIGTPGSGRDALARRIAAEAGMRAVRIPPTFWSAPDRVERLRPLARDARLDDLLPILDAAPRDGEPLAAAALDDAVALIGGPVIVLATAAASMPPTLWREHLPSLGTEDRHILWRTALGSRAPDVEVAAVAAQFPFGPDEIADIAASLGPATSSGALWRRCRARGGPEADRLAVRVAPRFGWEDLVIPPAVEAELRAIADQVRHRTTVYEGWGFATRLATGRGVTALLAGPSGVGKTMAAEVIAGDLRLDLFKVDLSRLVSKYIGETEKNLARVFDSAEEAGACLFLDEADACLGKRSEVRDSHDRHANLEVSYLLQRIETYSGLCLMATNLKANLDPAFLRRLRFVVDLPPPDQRARRRIWQGAFPPGTPLAGLDFAALARLDIAGGSIVVIAVNAAFLAAAEGGPVTMERIAQAARGEFRKHDRTFHAPWAEGRV